MCAFLIPALAIGAVAVVAGSGGGGGCGQPCAPAYNPCGNYAYSSYGYSGVSSPHYTGTYQYGGYGGGYYQPSGGYSGYSNGYGGWR